MTTTERRASGNGAPARPKVAVAAAKAYVTMAERSGHDVPEWLRETAAGRLTPPPANT